MTPNKDNYKFRYIMQKDKNAPLAIIFPSIGEGINSHHSIIWAKIFYDEGYSVAILGSHFQWEFVKSMPDSYRPGIPTVDAKYLQELTKKIVEMYQKMIIPAVKDGICGCVYTQLSDVEDEINGFFTYDREICKVEKEKMKEVAAIFYSLMKNFLL